MSAKKPILHHLYFSPRFETTFFDTIAKLSNRMKIRLQFRNKFCFCILRDGMESKFYWSRYTIAVELITLYLCPIWTSSIQKSVFASSWFALLSKSVPVYLFGFFEVLSIILYRNILIMFKRPWSQLYLAHH